MSKQRPDRHVVANVEDRLGRWLKDDAPQMASELRASVRDQIRTTAQLAPDAPPEFRQRWRGRPVRLELLAAAAVFIVAVVGGLSVLQPPTGPGDSGLSSVEPSGLESLVGATTSPPQGSPQPSSTAEADPFSGTWQTLDVDGSVYVVIFEGTGATRRVTLTDLRGTVCAGGSHVIEATGTIQGSTIAYEGLSGCLGGAIDQPAGSTFTYDSTSNTLRLPFEYPGGDTLVWGRAPLTDAFDGTWTATDVDGSVLTLTFTGSGLSRAVVFTDDRAIPATCPGGGAYGAEGSGSIGTVADDGRFIRVSFHGACLDGSSPADYEQKFEYVKASGELAGPLEPLDVGATPLPITVRWHRP